MIGPNHLLISYYDAFTICYSSHDTTFVVEVISIIYVDFPYKEIKQ
jgi:hypothetical protein